MVALLAYCDASWRKSSFAWDRQSHDWQVVASKWLPHRVVTPIQLEKYVSSGDEMTTFDTPPTSQQSWFHLAQPCSWWDRGSTLQDDCLYLRPSDSPHHLMTSQYHWCFGGQVWEGVQPPCKHVWLDLVCWHSLLCSTQQTWGKKWELSVMCANKWKLRDLHIHRQHLQPLQQGLLANVLWSRPIFSWG